MLSKQVTLIHLSLLVCLFSFLTSCSNNKAAQNLFAADPKLTENSGTSDPPSETTPNPTPVQNSPNFPQEIPLYPGATLVDRESVTGGKGEKTLWESADPSNLIANYYQRELPVNNWKILEVFSADSDNTLVASRDGAEVKISIVRTSPNTQFSIEYQGMGTSSQSETEPSNPNLIASGPQNFSDLDQVTPQLSKYIEDLAALGILTPTQKKDDGLQANLFKPNQTITRREYALWLVSANNQLHINQAGKQIRLASQTSQPAFQDIKPKEPDFAVIQGLAEAGVIPSPLTGDSSKLLFRPDAPLTRENLLEWKVPLDLRKALPLASMETIKETWGFQDATKINNPKALRSLYADFQNGEQANVRRVFGYTTLFQPKKAVTRAEAAAALWYFGYQGEGISAEEALQLSKNN